MSPGLFLFKKTSGTEVRLHLGCLCVRRFHSVAFLVSASLLKLLFSIPFPSLRTQTFPHSYHFHYLSFSSVTPSLTFFLLFLVPDIGVFECSVSLEAISGFGFVVAP